MIKVGVICEFNPFHNGHKLLFDRIRTQFAPNDVCIICIMSGNFVQRGTLALFSKYTRAEIAVDMGADLVLELPFPWSASYAQSFARAGVHIADSLGGIDFLAFGSESFDDRYISECAHRIASDDFDRVLSDKLHKNKNTAASYAGLREETFFELYSEQLPIRPNEVLALEYHAAIERIKSEIKPLLIRRDTDYSASTSRKYLSEDDLEALAAMIPDKVTGKTLRASRFSEYLPDAALILFLASADPEALAESPEMSFDLASRLVNMAKSGKYDKADALLSASATKKYTNARIRRALNFSYLSVKREDLAQMPAYTSVLACSLSGREVLREFSKTANISILSTKAAHNKLSDEAAKQYSVSERADRAFSFCGRLLPNEGDKPYIKI